MITMLDAKIFLFINKALVNPVFDLLMPSITNLGDKRFILALAVLLIVIFYRSKKGPGILLLIGLAVSALAANLLKVFFSKPRPFIAFKDVHLLVKELDKNHSFPSGHATLVFMAAVILASYFKRGYLFFIAAIIVCFSRVYVGVHYVSDVLAGAALGGAIGYVLVYAAKRLRRE